MSTAPKAASVRRIAALIANLNEITRYSLELRQQNQGYCPSEVLEDLHSEIDRQMGIYAGATPKLRFVDETGAASFGLTGPSRSRITVPEWEALDVLMRLARQGLLQRVRQCETCTVWFYARFDHQTSHDKGCRIAKYRASDKWKEKNRAQQRDRYWTKKRGITK